ncbi:hypothetical protein ABQF26_18535 [Mycolicibacterium elephantis]
MGRTKRTLDRFGQILTGSWMFWWGRPNGGTIILFRAVQISLLMYLAALWLRSLFNATWPWQFAPSGLWHDGATTVPWLGAIYLAVYAALYTRFSNHMNYLCNTYNLLMQTQASIDNPDANKKIQLWKVALVEDAEDMHLATKRMFSVLCYFILNDETLGPMFEANTSNGTERRENLKKNLLKAMGPNLPARIKEPSKPTEETPIGQTPSVGSPAPTSES